EGSALRFERAGAFGEVALPDGLCASLHLILLGFDVTHHQRTKMRNCHDGRPIFSRNPRSPGSMVARERRIAVSASGEYVEETVSMHVLFMGAAGMVGRKLVASLVRDARIGGKAIKKLTLSDVVEAKRPA